MNAEANPSPALVHPIVGPRTLYLVRNPEIRNSDIAIFRGTPREWYSWFRCGLVSESVADDMVAAGIAVWSEKRPNPTDQRAGKPAEEKQVPPESGSAASDCSTAGK